MIFVFGSNLKGIHGAGAAAYAHSYCGAAWGVGEGPTGAAYAIPTCSVPGVPLPLDEIAKHVERFLTYAREQQVSESSENASMFQFQVTRVGCGLAGYSDAEIAPMFRASPDNVWLPAAWLRVGAHGMKCPHNATYTLASGWTEEEVR